MIYLVGGAPRAGKSLLGQRVAARLGIGWVSTDLLVDLLRVHDKSIKAEWDAAPEAILANANWFWPYLERFVWGVASQAEDYLVEGVAFLPAQVERLAGQYAVRAVFIGCSNMSLEKLDAFPGRSRGYGGLPDAFRRQIARDVPVWSAFIRQEAEAFGCAYVDTGDDFADKMDEAEGILTRGRSERAA